MGLSWAVFGAILSHSGVILGPFLDPFGANFQVGQADLKISPKQVPGTDRTLILGEASGHFWDHFLVIFGVIFWTTFWSLFGPLLGAILGLMALV